MKVATAPAPYCMGKTCTLCGHPRTIVMLKDSERSTVYSVHCPTCKKSLISASLKGGYSTA